MLPASVFIIVVGVTLFLGPLGSSAARRLLVCSSACLLMSGAAPGGIIIVIHCVPQPFRNTLTPPNQRLGTSGAALAMASFGLWSGLPMLCLTLAVCGAFQVVTYSCNPYGDSYCSCKGGRSECAGLSRSSLVFQLPFHCPIAALSLPFHCLSLLFHCPFTARSLSCDRLSLRFHCLSPPFRRPFTALSLLSLLFAALTLGSWGACPGAVLGAVREGCRSVAIPLRRLSRSHLCCCCLLPAEYTGLIVSLMWPRGRVRQGTADPDPAALREQLLHWRSARELHGGEALPDPRPYTA